MSTGFYYFSGKVNWAKVRKPDDYDRYTLDLYMDEKSWPLFEESGLNLKRRENDDGETFVKLSRPIEKEIKGNTVEYGPPEVLDAEGNELPEDVLIGNGSDIICKVAVYDTRAGMGHRLESIKVIDLVEYSSNVEEHAPEGVDAW